MRKYNARVLTVEKGSFTPLVYTTFGGWAPQASKYHKQLARLIARKRNEDYHHVISHIRTKVRFSLLKSVLIAVQGERGMKQLKVVHYPMTFSGSRDHRRSNVTTLFNRPIYHMHFVLCSEHHISRYSWSRIFILIPMARFATRLDAPGNAFSRTCTVSS